MTPVERVLWGAAGGLGAFFLMWLTRRDDRGGYRRPIASVVAYAGVVAVCVYVARAHGAGTWTGLFFAALVPFNLWMGFRAGVEAWVEWMVRRDAAKRAASRKAGGR